MVRKHDDFFWKANAANYGGIRFDLSDFERLAAKLGGAADQLPFALANAMSRAVFVTRDVIIDEVWPQHVEVRNTRFLSSALKVEKATKSRLSVALYDSLGRGHLNLHAHGGTKQAKKRLAIPVEGSVKRTARGVPKRQKPRALIDSTPKRALRILPSGIFIGRGGRLHLVYSFKQSVHQGQDVPFDQAWNRIFVSEMKKAFPRALEIAMATRRTGSRYDTELAKGRRQIKTKGKHGNTAMYRGTGVSRTW